MTLMTFLVMGVKSCTPYCLLMSWANEIYAPLTLMLGTCALIEVSHLICVHVPLVPSAMLPDLCARALGSLSHAT